MTVSRQNLIAAMASAADISDRAASRALAAIEDSLLAAASAGASVRLPGILSLDVVARAERQGRNPRSGEPLTVAAAHVARLKPGSRLRAAAAASRAS
ncbi:HU family DNA-binding protein [Demequina sp. NBRC 110052]|uniref:HU family DNA-binding protein n=1 Tax=Demequina sp. NBRC 110052 TaxID=1570341 RepID=UPI000A032E72